MLASKNNNIDMSQIYYAVKASTKMSEYSCVDCLCRRHKKDGGERSGVILGVYPTTKTDLSSSVYVSLPRFK